MQLTTHRALRALAILALAATTASAQSMNPAAGSGLGTGTTPGATPGPTAMPTDLDLPLEKPVWVNPNPTPPGPPTSDDGDTDDPRDEPPPVIYGEEIDSESDTIFYVIDISGSMIIDTQSYTGLDGQTLTGNRMERAKAELMRSVMALSPNFKMNIIAFDCGTRLWAQEMKEANAGNKAAAVAWVKALSPTGATGTGPACALALADKANKSVVLLTDGAPNCGANSDAGHRSMISAANTQGATVNVFGIAASGTYRTFCQNVASDSGGSYFDVP